ncbi:MAG TPA: glucosamine-6-phosphate deaminase [Terriglobales bacterium]|nr:glucosamine-6-phosphate deaminase [Terriglobales bacterium]
MQLKIFDDKLAMARGAAEYVASSLRSIIGANGRARIVTATGAAQFDFLDALTSAPGIEWGLVEMFHLDEYVGISVSHPASFQKFLLDRLINKTGIRKYHLLNPGANPKEVADRVGTELNSAPIDLSIVGIGENGHLAFNDPPADFETEQPYLIVDLDEVCRLQQVGEGWFKNLAEVPRQAISMSVRQILRAKEIVAIVPDSRKAQAVKSCFEGPISPLAPASILRTHPNTTIYLDRDSSALLTPEKTLVG